MDSPGKSGDEKILKKNASSSFAAVGNKDGDNLVTLASAPSINLNNKEVEKGDRPSRRKKKRSVSHKRAPVSPEGPFPKGAAEIHPSELEYDPADEATIIGKGMYGTVYEGRCRGLRVAIKVLNDQKMDAKSLRKFKDEVELMAGLNHTRVVLFLGACMLENGKVACVTEYLPNGNLETVLESKDIQLTMLDKLKYARDIALGCNWLHHSNPLIIHRDLKPSNLLLDDNGRVKVCDFGLSLAQPEHSKGFRSSRIVGTPLYTSPETIKGKTITTKADVYSYGVVLWQILTRLEPFLECEDSDEVYEVVKKGQRPPLTMPPLPAETTPALRQLVADCWQNSPRKRPSFDEILTRLEVMLIEYAIPDPHGAELWKSRFLGKDEVSWPKFVSTFAADDRFGAATISPHSPPVRCLKNLLATEASPTAVVTLKSFGDFCSWFGPLVPGVHDEQINITKKIVAILRCPWFHASVTNKQARSMLVQQPIGTFLVRYNESVRGGWIISYVAESSEEGSSGSLNDGHRKSRKSINEKATLEGGANEKDDGNGVKRGRIKHVRIYFDKSQPDLGYQLLLPAKPKALQDQPSPHTQPSPTAAAIDSEALSGIHGSSSSSSTSLNESGGATGMGEAFKRYVWSSYTTYIVDFINQLLDKNWPGREYLDINYPCPGSRFASIFAQSSPGEESSDSVLGGSVLVRYLNSMTSVDDLKRDKQKDKQPEQQQPAVVGTSTRDNVGKERKAQQQQNGGGGDDGATVTAKELNGAKRPQHVEKKKAKKDDHGKAERKKERARLREQQQKENERTATTTTTTSVTTDEADHRRPQLHANGHTNKEEAQKKKERKKEKKDKASKKESNRERSKSKPEKIKKSGGAVVEAEAEKVRPKTIHQILAERDREVKERKEKKKAEKAEKANNRDEKDAKEKEKGSKRLRRSKKTDNTNNKESEKESTTSVVTTDASESKTPPKKKKGSKKKEKEEKKSEGEKEEKEKEKEKGSKKEKKEKRVSRRLRRTAEDTVTVSLITTSPSKAALKKEKKEKDKLAKKEKLLNGHNGA